MKYIYLLILPFFVCLIGNAQDVHVTLGKSSREAVSGYKSFNLQNLKYYAKRSKNYIDKLLTYEDFINCTEAFDLANSINIYLESALFTEDFATAKAHLIRAEETSTEAFNAYNLCSENTDSLNSSIETKDNVSQLSELEEQQLQLKRQQEALVQKEMELKQKMIEQDKKKVELQKQNLIERNNNNIISNISTYNASLKACDCTGSISSPETASSELLTKNIEQLKAFYLNKTITIAKEYVTLLTNCKLK